MKTTIQAIKKRTLIFAIIITSVVSIVNASTISGTCGSSLTWNLTNGVLTIEGSGNMSDYEYNGSPWFPVKDSILNISISSGVTNVGDNAFYGCSMLTSVMIPDGVVSIGNCSFYGCYKLATLTIPNTVTIIKSEAFHSCKSLTCLTIPDNVTNIESYAFYGCSNLTLLTIPDGISNIGVSAFVDVPNILYNGTLDSSSWGARCLNGVVDGWLVFNDLNKTILKVCAPAATGNVIIPNSVTSIEEEAFLYCKDITSVYVSNNVSTIGIRAFGGCSNLQTISIPNKVVSIGDYAFALCSKLESITLPNSVISVGTYAFRNCSRLTSITLGEGLMTIGNFVFENCIKLTSIYVPCGQLERFKVMLSNDNRIKYLPSFNINLATENGQVIASPHQTRCDSIVILTPYPNTGYHFDNWSDGSSENPRAIVLTQDTTFCALFAINQYSISVSCDLLQGSIEGENGTFNYGTELRYNATANEGFHFLQWSDGIKVNPRTIVLTQDTTLYAEFALNTYIVKFFGFNSVLLDSQSVEHGKDAIAPEAPMVDHYDFICWDKEYTNITSHLDVFAIYQENHEDVSNVNIETPPHKVMIDGQVLIQRGKNTYTLIGIKTKQ